MRELPWETHLQHMIEEDGEELLPQPGDHYLSFHLEGEKGIAPVREMPVARSSQPLRVERIPCMTDNAIRKARVVKDPRQDTHQIELLFTDGGAKRLEAITTANVGKQLAVVIDGRVITAPVIKTTIAGGKALITGDFSQQDAEQIATKLNAYRQAVREMIDEITVKRALSIITTSSARGTMPASLLLIALKYRPMALSMSVRSLIHFSLFEFQTYFQDIHSSSCYG